ncbi:hypothetical protein D920_01888 [Enterococcus faecalis 13-SD-W-01]|nr:hypothetical protein D920_01888 [Enterococcus faecalis 13-SD-W-01]
MIYESALWARHHQISILKNKFFSQAELERTTMVNWITNITPEKNKHNADSGFVANNDMTGFALEIGFQKIDYIRYDDPQFTEEEMMLIVKEQLAAVKKGDNVFVQFPTWQRLKIESLFFQRLFELGVNVSLVIWDVLPWLHDGSERDFTNEYAFRLMNKCDLLIVPNKKMALRLQTEAKVTTKMISIDLWDYKIKEQDLPRKKFEEKLFFVGTLDKTDFTLYKKNYPLNLIGNIRGLSEEERQQKNLHILGEKRNEEIPRILDGGFGLVSYKAGTNKNRFKGAEKYGHYNNPLKLSLYLAAGLPVIVDSNSAHADFVRKQNIGIVLEDINNIDLLFQYLTEEDYQKMCINVEKLANLITHGHFSKYALQQAIDTLKEEKL